jgi:hypothetical protein
MRLPFALSSVSGLSRHTLFSAGFTTNMFGFEFSVHNPYRERQNLLYQ